MKMSEQEQAVFLELSSAGRNNYLRMGEVDKVHYKTMTLSYSQKELELYLSLSSESRKLFRAMTETEVKRFIRETESFPLTEKKRYIAMSPEGRKMYLEMDVETRDQFLALKFLSSNEEDVYLRASDFLRMIYLRMSAVSKLHFRNMMSDGKLDSIEHRYKLVCCFLGSSC